MNLFTLLAATSLPDCAACYGLLRNASPKKEEEFRAGLRPMIDRLAALQARSRLPPIEAAAAFYAEHAPRQGDDAIRLAVLAAAIHVYLTDPPPPPATPEIP